MYLRGRKKLLPEVVEIGGQSRGGGGSKRRCAGDPAADKLSFCYIYLASHRWLCNIDGHTEDETLSVQNI